MGNPAHNGLEFFMVTLTRVREVAAGDPVLDKDAASLGYAINDRIRCGAPDCAWRIFFYFFKLWTQVRRADENNQFPAMGEFLEFYMHVDRREATWPLTTPDDPEGANVASAMMGYLFGTGPDMSEAARLGVVPLRLPGDVLPTEAAGYWEMAKGQRGVIVPGAGSNAPAMDAAVSYWLTQNVGNERHGRSYGGYLPVPEGKGDENNCGDGDGFTAETPNQRIYFTPIDKGPLTAPYKEYEGTCPPGGNFGDAPKHVAWIGRTPRAYYVRLNDGTVDVLPTKDYVEGPYKGGGVLSKRWGWHLNRVFNDYIAGFSGTPGQKAAEDFDEDKFGWDTERFLKAQYFLAPNIGHEEGEEWVADYPEAAWLASDLGLTAGAGTLGKFGDGTTEHAYAAGFVLGGVLLRAAGLTGSAEVEVLSAGRVLRKGRLEADEAGNAATLLLFEAAERPQPLRFRLAGAARFADGAGWIKAEANEIMEYKPDLDDLFVAVRLSSAGSGPESGLGEEESEARELGERWFETGAIVNGRTAALTGEEEAANRNAVFETARAMTRASVRLLNRQALVGYEVNGEGKSVLYFKRHATAGGVTVDLLEGIAPPAKAVESGKMALRTLYVARGPGSVSYDGHVYTDGEEFEGTAETGFEASGGCEVYEREGIVAPGIGGRVKPGGMSNEWVMEIQTKNYSLEGGIFTPEVHADYFPLSERCHWLSPYIDPVFRPDLWRHFDYGKKGAGGEGLFALAPEAPTGYRYASGANERAGTGSEEFFRSCRIYEPPNEVESATVLFEDGEEIVRLVFKKRFQNTGDRAPLPIGRDVGSWDADGVRAEAQSRRTTENAIREYLLHATLGPEVYNCVKGAVGDTGLHSNAFSQFDNLWGSCYPHFLFVKLLEVPHMDGNEEGEATDTRMGTYLMRRTEWMVRGMCEGYVDERASQNLCSDTVSNLMDYTFENLAFDAFGGRWLGTLPGSLRPDLPCGFGPLQRNLPYAEVWNRMARMVNLLTKVRLPLPFKFLYYTRTNTASKPEGQSWPDAHFGCPWDKALALGGALIVDRPDMDNPPPSDDEWREGRHVEVSASIGLNASCVPGHGAPCVTPEAEPPGDGGIPTTPLPQWVLAGTRQVARYRFELADGGMLAAIPEELLGPDGGIPWENTRFLGWFEDQELVAKGHEAATAEESAPCSSVADGDLKRFWDGSRGYWFEDVPIGTPGECRIFGLSKGELDTEVPAGGDFFLCQQPTSSIPCGFAVVGNSNSRRKAVTLAEGATPFVEFGTKEFES